MSSPASSSATLEKSPLLHLLVSIADRQLSGTLLFAPPDETGAAVVFDRGIPRKTSAATPHCRLSDLLIELGWLDALSAEETYAMALTQKEPHGKVLVDCRLVDEAGLAHVLRHQLVRKLEWIAERPPRTRLVLHENVDMLAQMPCTPVDVSPLSIVWALAKCRVDERHMRLVLGYMGDRPLQLHKDSAPELFGFNEAEMSVVHQLRLGHPDVAELLNQVGRPQETAEVILYVLLLTHHIDIGDGRSPVGIGREPRAPRPATSEECSTKGSESVARKALRRDYGALDVNDQLKRDLQTLATRASSFDYYTLLGVARDAPVATIHAAFTNLAQRYHPDRLPADLLDLRCIAIQLQGRLNAAHRTLTNEAARVQYDKESPPPSSGTDRERVARRARSIDALRRAELWLKRDHLVDAEVEAARALELDPTNPRCMALHAWIQSLLPTGQDRLAPLLAALTRALDLDPVDTQTRFYRSQILKRLERLDEAVGEWRFIIEMNPNHIDAQRELRLWEMRRGSTHPPKSSQSGTRSQVSLAPAPPGLFGRLFRGNR